MIKRLHTDEGGEWFNHSMEEFCNQEGIKHTSNAGHDPRGNGRAERYVGILKSLARQYLIHNGLGPSFWSYAMEYACYCYQLKVMYQKKPRYPLEIGERVLIRIKPDRLTSFGDQMEEGVFLTWNSHVTDGAKVLVGRGSSPIVVNSSYMIPYLDDNGESVKRIRWKLFVNPDTGDRHWISENGRSMWNPTVEELDHRLVSFEERHIPMGEGDVLEGHLDDQRNQEDSGHDRAFSYGTTLSLTQLDEWLEEELRPSEDDEGECEDPEGEVPGEQEGKQTEQVEDEDRPKWGRGVLNKKNAKCQRESDGDGNVIQSHTSNMQGDICQSGMATERRSQRKNPDRQKRGNREKGHIR